MKWIIIAAILLPILIAGFILLKKRLDARKEKTILSEVYRVYGFAAKARINSIQKRTSNGKDEMYDMMISFEYPTLIKKGELSCTTHLHSNHPDVRKYLSQKEIPVFLIPQYIDYLNKNISKEELFQEIGWHLNLQTARMLVFAKDIEVYTNLRIR
jgi:hypothetical protein